MRITVIGLVVGRDLFRRAVQQLVQEQFTAGVVDNGVAVSGPAWVVEPDLLPLGVGEGCGIRDCASLHVEVGDVEGAAWHIGFEVSEVIEADLFFVRRNADAVEAAGFCQLAGDAVERRLAARIRIHEKQTVPELRWGSGDEQTAIAHRGMDPCVITRVSQGDFLPRLSADSARHDRVTTRALILAVPHGRVLAVTSPCGIEVGVRPAGELVKAGAIRVDYAKLGDPVAHDGIVL